jgi:aldehyde dehydrogenase (NAD+)
MENTSEEKIKHVFEAQQKHQYQIAVQSVSERKAKLKALYKAIKTDFRQEIRDAMFADFRKPAEEVDLSEVLIILNEIKEALRHLNHWTKPKPVRTPITLWGSSSNVYYEPKGVCLIISPWNFPFNLSFGPLVSAIAAGNTVILKPSEMTPNSSAVIRRIVESLFSENEVFVAEGGIEVSTNLLNLPFNHIFFTGSPAVGKIVMAAAAKNLASVTLELGGKSPTIIDESADLKLAARRIAWGKHLNGGQICIAPDYILIHENCKEEFLMHYKEYITRYYGDSPDRSPYFSGMVNNKHTQRLAGYITNATENGAKIVLGGDSDESNQYVAPTVLVNLSSDSKLLEEEIFGPVTPVLTFKAKEEAVEFIQKKEKPLALYIFSNNKSNINYFIKNTRAGGGCINMVDVHFFNHFLPFGGSNNSGIGKSHGYEGFKAFSNERGILRQWFPGAAELLAPPYTSFKKRLIRFVTDKL